MTTAENNLEILGRTVTIAADGESTATRRWQHRVTSTGSIPSASSLGLPEIGTVETFAGVAMRLASYDIEEDEKTGTIVYTANYSDSEGDDGETGSDGGDGGDGGTVTPPAGGDPIIVVSKRFSAVSYTGQISHDAVTGKPIVMPTGEPPAGQINGQTSGRLFEVVYLVGSVPAGLLAASGTTNAGTMHIEELTVPRHCGLLTASAEQLSRKDGLNYRVTVSVEIRMDKAILSPGQPAVTIGHDMAILLSGYRYKDDSGNIVQAMESDGDGGMRPVSAPVFLDAEGARVSPNADGTGACFMQIATIPEGTWKNSWFPQGTVSSEESETPNA